MDDPYETLGVARSVTDKEIKEAFKKLARKSHPDLNPGDKTVEETFKAVSNAKRFPQGQGQGQGQGEAEAARCRGN